MIQNLPANFPKISADEIAKFLCIDECKTCQKRETDKCDIYAGRPIDIISELEKPTSGAINESFNSDPNSYAFWGPDAEKIVKTPESLYIPISYDAYKASVMFGDHKLKSNAPYDELTRAIAEIIKWTRREDIDKFFMKNATFSGKHRWPHTCYVNMGNIEKNDIIGQFQKIQTHICNINKNATDSNSRPGLGILVRKLLDLKPEFYAFGATFFTFKNNDTGEIAEIKILSGRHDADDVAVKFMDENPNMQFINTARIGMPITKELRIFAIDKKVVGSVPYWTPRAFQDQNIFSLATSLEDALATINHFTDEQYDYLTRETDKIVNHPKFSELNWAIDWIQTKNGDWYMTDMQTAESSYMDFHNMKFTSDDAKNSVYAFMNKKLETLAQIKKQTPILDKLLMYVLFGNKLNIDKRLTTMGYPTSGEIRALCQNNNSR